MISFPTLLFLATICSSTAFARNSHDRRKCIARHGNLTSAGASVTANADNIHQRPSVTKSASSTSVVPPKSSNGKLVQSWTGGDFFDWIFFTNSDPTHGLVNYVDKQTAQNDKLAYVNDKGQFIMAVDSTSNIGFGQPRNSVRISSNSAFGMNQVLILDAAHMPTGCGTWPAFWTVGKNLEWPDGGEIDIVEGVNNIDQNQISLHTADQCDIPTSNNGATGQVLNPTCQFQPGCSFKDPSPSSFGGGFNSVNGGVFATTRTDPGIKVYFWPRAQIPEDITSGNPNPSTWGTPKAFFPNSGECALNVVVEYYQTIIFDTTLGGDWAAAVFSSQCPQDGDIQSYIEKGSHFEDAYWAVNSVSIYKI